jgi:hypothetical protein
MRQLFLILLLGCAACSSVAQPPPAAAEDLPQQIRALIGNAACSESSQCHALPLGANACGGPQSYLPWSSAATSDTALRALAERYKTRRQAQISATGEISTCRFLPDPGAECRAGACQLRSGGAPEVR